MAALIELFVQLLAVDADTHHPDAPAWLRRYRALSRGALVLTGSVVLPLLGLLAWRLCTG